MSVKFESPTRHISDTNSLYSAPSDNESSTTNNNNIHQDFLNVIQARQQQLQTRTTGWSKKNTNGLYRQPIEDLAPMESKDLNILLNDPTTKEHELLIIDIRSFNFFKSSRIKSAINVSIPSILLKRPSYTIEKICELITYDKLAADRLKSWSNAKHIIFYDHFSYATSDSGNSATAILLGSKLRTVGYKGQLNYLQGGIKTFHEQFPEQCELNSLVESNNIKRKRPNNNTMQLPLPTNNVLSNSTPINPFFSNIRQNLELSHGPLKERFSVRLPWGLQNNHGTISSSTTSCSLAYSNHNTHHPRFGLAGSSVDEQGNFVLPIWLRNVMNSEKGPKKLAEMYEKLERVEQDRLLTIMNYHSKQDQPLDNRFPFSITASMEKGVLNRYDNIWPFAYSRVKLIDKPDDYINANYIQYANIKKDITLSPIHQSEQEIKLQKQGLLSQESLRTMNRHNVELDCNRQYISTQGPLPTTFNDFWQLIWHEHSFVIVMLTQEMEMNKIKCHRYWPTLVHVPQTYGSMQVTLLSESKHSVLNLNEKRDRDDLNDSIIIIRKFSLKYASQERIMTHLQYTGWTDFGVPDDPIGLLQLVHHADEATRYHQSRNEHVGPMTVHCSAGCGRSGTFCVVDTIIQRLWHEHDVYTSTTVDKIQQTIARFREQRMSLVQTHRQFVFCYEAILWWLLGYGYLPAASTTTTTTHEDPVYTRAYSKSPLPFDAPSSSSSSIGSIVEDFKDL
ncbi:protein-tyrosine phosphatase-like protein [Pilaira anomala]|nr:protein-tyrosine phosphatase-like protein [Pilaira anomala]